MAAENIDMISGQYRRIYAGYITSRKIAKLSIGAEAWFWRLHSIADDYGNFNGDPALVWKEASGRRDITVQQAAEWTKEVLDAKLAYAYYSDDDVFIHIIGFEEKQIASNRNGKRFQKYPIHPDESSHTVEDIEGALRKSQEIPENPAQSGKLEDGQRCIRKIQAHHNQYHNHNQYQDQNHLLPEAADAAPASGTKPVPPKKKPPAEKKPLEPDPIWNELARIFYPSSVATSQESLMGRAVRDLKQKHATPEEICRRVARWPTVYPDASFPKSPAGLVDNWDALREPEKPKDAYRPFQFEHLGLDP